MTAQKILVAYASRGGSTAGVAEEIGKTLAKGGAQVDVRHMNDVQDLELYEAVVLGSAIRGAAWLPEAMEFLRRNHQALSGKPLATFLVCITLAMPAAAGHGDFVLGFLKDVRALVRPVSEGCFAGALDASKLPLVPDGLQARILSAASRTPMGDYRDWNAIRGWAEQLPALLHAAEAREASARPVSQRLPSLVI
jgi:menaquinone-dependent protoporphyrinogen oxidase